MTIKEAKEIMQQFRDRQGNSKDDNEALDMAIKALEQQPCEDCISSTDLIAVMHLIMDDAKIGDNDEDYESLDDIKQQYIEIVKGMTSVTSQPKKGQWLDKKMTIKGGHGLAYGRYGCSVCKKKQPSKTDFCPNCGADMREV